jgi:heptosyltransferase III
MRVPHILFIAPTRIGDAVLATSILAHLLKTKPDAKVTIVTSTLAAPLFEGYPLRARTIAIVKQTYNRHWLKVWRETVGTFWDEVWDLRGSAITFGVRTDRRHWYRPAQVTMPKVKHYGIMFGTGPLPYPQLWPRPADIAAAEQLMQAAEKFLVFAPIANWEPKEWPMAHYIALAQSLLGGTFAGYRPVLICAPHEATRAQAFLDALAPYRPLNLSQGDHHLLTVYACMQRAHGFVGNDSGLMHMAAAAGIPTLGLFGPGQPEVYQPCGPKAAHMVAPERDLAQLTPAMVEATFTTLLAS